MAKESRRRTGKTQPGVRSVSRNGEVVRDLADGMMKFQIHGGQYDSETIEMDPMLVKLAAERLERKHKLAIVDGRWEATAEFAVELSQSLQGLGYHCTPTIAILAWVAVSEHFAEIQKKTS